MSDRCRVLVLPGLAASDRSTGAIRASLAANGHHPHRWRLGRNEGPSDELVAALDDRLGELYRRDHAPVALVGWSMGGLYAHWLARRSPQLVRSVITLGSPLRHDARTTALAVATTSVFSRLDHIVPWQASLVDGSAARHENVEVRATHFGLGFDPAVLYLINDRLRRPPERWQPFKPPRWLRLAFPDPSRSAA